MFLVIKNLSFLILTSSLLGACSERQVKESKVNTSVKADINSNSSWSQSIGYYKSRFDLSDAYAKQVDNHGNGDEKIYGVRNFRVVLHGVLYRGGANNLYNSIEKRDNSNPLPTTAVENLCQAGFSKAIYLYSTNASQMLKSTKCMQNQNLSNELNYTQISGLEKDNVNAILNMVYNHIIEKQIHPIFAHCWNGWHASGFVSAAALMQFCNISPEKALAYWIQNTDKNDTGFEKIKKRILSFKKNPAWSIDEKTSNEICPKL